ncbi:MAG: hypothetical protein CMH57_10640 [Myxococcales bacterium]|nr:hypothetical protein [Myxococcales bacterium]
MEPDGGGGVSWDPDAGEGRGGTGGAGGAMGGAGAGGAMGAAGGAAGAGGGAIGAERGLISWMPDGGPGGGAAAPPAPMLFGSPVTVKTKSPM